VITSESTGVTTRTIRLTEYQDWVGDLGDEDAKYALSQLSPKVAIRRRVQDGLYVLNPNQFVGVVTLPSQRRLESHPKVPLRNLFYMLAVAFDLPSPFMEQTAKFERLVEILEFVVSYFAELVEKRIDEGLYRSYVEQENNLATIQGRIEFAEDLRRNYVMRHRTYCRYDEFSWDIPENQVIRQVLHLLGGWGFGRELRLRLHGLDAALSEVTPTDLPLSSLDWFQYNRFNEDYRQIHRFCTLFLEGASLSEESGPFDFQTFLIDMDKLFERFVTQILRKRAGVHTTVEAQVSTHLGLEQKVLMRPDIIVSEEGTLVLVADCKYKRLEPSEFKNHDIYQMLAYCTATQVKRGLLIYPLHAAVIQDEVKVRNTQTVIKQITINLGKEEIKELDQECDAFADAVLSSIWSYAG
jgi:5-methylcytosine-specific restriction enzyme subunit McrC